MASNSKRRHGASCYLWRCATAVCLLLLCGQRRAGAQEQPSLTINWDDANQTRYRQDVCERFHNWDDRDIDLRFALRGYTLNPILLMDQYFQLNEDGAIDPDNPGLLVMLLDEVAARAGFEWRNSFAVVDGPYEGSNWDQLLLSGVDSFDFFASWWATNIERLNAGVAFPKGWNDASIILVGTKVEESVTVNLWNWVEPFSMGVWLLFLATILWSAFVNLLIEALTQTRDGRSLASWFGDSFFESSMMFSGEYNNRPKTGAARILAISFTVWALLLGATYTANLASFFVDERQSGRTIDSIEDATAAGLAICSWDGVYSDVWLDNSYPEAILIKYKTEELMYRGLLDGDCIFAVSSISSFELYERDAGLNGDCSLEQVGHVLTFAESGFATQADVGKLCTSLIRDVLNVHMMEMDADGTFKRLWDTHISHNADLNCALEESENSGEDDLSLSVYEMAGTFFMHFFMTLLALFMAVLRSWRKKMRKISGGNSGGVAEKSSDLDLQETTITERADEFRNRARHAETTIGRAEMGRYPATGTGEQVEELKIQMAEMSRMLASMHNHMMGTDAARFKYGSADRAISARTVASGYGDEILWVGRSTDEA